MTEAPALIRFLSRIFPGVRSWLASVTARVDDSPGWEPVSGTQFDLTWAEFYKRHLDTLEAWRKSPLGRRIVSLTTDFVVGDGITLSSPYKALDGFIRRFWAHPKNNMAQRIEAMCDELTRAGELFVVLNRNPADGMSYIRLVPASEIDIVEWAPGDYETETQYHQRTDEPEGRWWKAPNHPDAAKSDQIMLHYAINRPVGCVRGEGDLAPILTWLMRYSQWLEDRARLNWAARVFIWLVTVPANKVKAKRAQYQRPPEPGSVVVKDDAETWEFVSPSIQARDASADGRAMRYMIGAGAGVPLHMLGEGEATNYATAQAQSAVTLRHYRRRQLFFVWMLSDIVVHAWELYRRTGRGRAVTVEDIRATTAEIQREDNKQLAAAGRDIVQMLAGLRAELRAAGRGDSEALDRKMIELAFRFAGEVLTEDEITRLLGSSSSAGETGGDPELEGA